MLEILYTILSILKTTSYYKSYYKPALYRSHVKLLQFYFINEITLKLLDVSEMWKCMAKLSEWEGEGEQ